jgi:DNA topoisomerase-1
MPRPLIIVESPAKAKTIAGYLGDEFTVESSVGHIRDLAVSSDLPAVYKQEPWSNYGVDIYGSFKPVYVVADEKKKKVRELKALMKQADELYLATDEDREGEAIAWHLLEELNPPQGMPVRRMVFHEITPSAIQEALDNPRDVDRRLVDAQETRRILDRLFGWDATAVTRKVVGQGSAGRVQSVAVRIVVERERERMAHVSAGYWGLDATAQPTQPAAPDDARPFATSLTTVDGSKLAVGRDFDSDGRPKRDVVVLDQGRAEALATELGGTQATVSSVERKPYRRRPAAPFMTSTLQQEAGRKLRFSAARAMSAAQALYEQGFITYMRTDSTSLSETALEAARTEIRERFGADNLPDAPRQYTRKVKNAQEAHEAIRPAGDSFRHPDEVTRQVSSDMAKLYQLVWQRTVASQMTDATGETVTVRFEATPASGARCGLQTSGTIISHPGFRLAYVEDRDEGDADEATERRLPALSEGDVVDLLEVSAEGHETQPPARYTEASLVKRMEELGVGRPSTYASIIATIVGRDYVWKKGSALVPSWSAFAVTQLLEQFFTNYVDYGFTAGLEDDLDQVSAGTEEMVPWLSRFYWGEPGPQPPGEEANAEGLRGLVEHLPGLDVRAINAVPLGVDEQGVPVEARSGRYGPFVSRGDDSASLPDDLPPDELTLEKALELLAVPKDGRPLGEDPATGKTVYAKNGRFGPYVQLGELVEGSKDKPRTASLFQTMTVERITLDDALELLTLPRPVATDPADGGVITAYNGRYGPYLEKVLPDGTKDSRSIDQEERLLTIDLDGALAEFAKPKRRRGQQSKPPLAELGEDPTNGKAIVIKDGRFGPYITDGETNITVPKGESPDEITHERAVDLLAEKRAKGPAKKKPAKKKSTRKRAAKKKPAKKSSAKKTAKKSAKKSTAKQQQAAPDDA